MSRSTRSPLSRVLSAGVAAAGAAALLTGCIVVSPVISETPKPTSTGFGSIADDPQPIETGNPVEPTTDPSAGIRLRHAAMASGGVNVPKQVASSRASAVQSASVAVRITGEVSTAGTSPDAAIPRRRGAAVFQRLRLSQPSTVGRSREYAIRMSSW